VKVARRILRLGDEVIADARARRKTSASAARNEK